MTASHSRSNGARSELRLEQMNLNLLLALHWLLVERSVTRAAVRLGVTQSAMSRSLGQLREWFDDPLLVPADRKMLLTARAEGLREPLTASLDGLRGLLRPPQAFDPATATGTVRVAATEHAMGAVVHEFVSRLGRRAPLLDMGLAPPTRRRPASTLAPGPARRVDPQEINELLACSPQNSSQHPVHSGWVDPT